MVTTAVAVWVRVPETAVKVRVYAAGAALAEGARWKTAEVVPATMLMAQAGSTQDMPDGAATVSATAAENLLMGVICAVKAVGGSPGSMAAEAGVMESLKSGAGPISVGVPPQPQPPSETMTACRTNASRTLGRRARMGELSARLSRSERVRVASAVCKIAVKPTWRTSMVGRVALEAFIRCGLLQSFW